MASSATGDGYSPLATPTRSSLRQPGSRAFTGTTNSVRFFGITHEDSDDDDHTSGVGPSQGRSSIALKQAIFRKYFNEFTSYPLLLANTSQKSSRGNSYANSRARKNVKNAIDTSSIRSSELIKAGPSWISLGTSHVQPDFQSFAPRWASRRPNAGKGKGKETNYGTGPLQVATQAVTSDRSLSTHLHAFETLLSKSWTIKEVQQAQTHGYLWLLVSHLGVERLQGPAALLLARCSCPRPSVLLPLTQRLCLALPLLISSPRQDVQQAGLCLLGLLWRAAINGPSQLPTTILDAPRLMESLAARTEEANFDALWTVREMATDARGVSALERYGILQAVCRALKRVGDAIKASTASTATAMTAGGGGGGGGGDTIDNRGQEGNAGNTQRLLRGRAEGKAPDPAPVRAAAPAAPGDKKPRGSRRTGITEGGPLVEQAARGVLVAECLTNCSSAHSAVLLMCDGQKIPSQWPSPERNRVPERLISLLVLVGKQLDENKEDDGKNSESGNGQTEGRRTATSTESVASAAKESSPEADSQGQRADTKALDRTEKANFAASSDDGYSEEFEEEVEEKEEEERQEKDKDKEDGGVEHIAAGMKTGGGEGQRSGSAKDGRSGGKSGSSGKYGGAGSGGGGAAREPGGDGGSLGGGGADGEGKEEQAAPQAVKVRKALRQLQDALLRGLYGIASSGHCPKAQQVVQEALRDAGDPIVERLAAVLYGHQRQESEGAFSREFLTLDACSAAAYLLWLIAAGDYSTSDASELNVLRARMAKETPSMEERKAAAVAANGGSRYDTSGLGVVPAVAELLVNHLPSWRDPILGDCVPAVGTTPPPPPVPSPPPVMKSVVREVPGRGGSAAGMLPSGGSDAAASVSGGLHGLTFQRGGGGGGGGGGITAAGTGDGTLSGDSHNLITQPNSDKGGGIHRDDVAGGVVGCNKAVPGPRDTPDGGDTDASATLRRVSPLRVGSATGLLLTPRDNKAGTGAAPSPQERYGSPDSSDDEPGLATVKGDGDHGDGGDGIPQTDSGALGDHLINTHDTDLGNLIDSSVELTGKENVMRMIAAAGSAMLSKEQQEQQLESVVQGQEVMDPEQATGAGASAAGAANDIATATAGSLPPIEPRKGLTLKIAGRVASPSEVSDIIAGSGCTPLGAPTGSAVPASRVSIGSAAAGGALAVPRQSLLEAARPPALTLTRTSSLRKPAPPPPPPPPPPVVPTVETWLGTVRFVRQGPRITRSPTVTQVQDLQTYCVGLLAAVALSGSGCKAICARQEISPYISSLLELPDIHDDASSDTATAALRSSGQELRLQLLALLTNLSLHQDGAAAIAAATSPTTSRLLGEGLYCTAERAIQLLSSNTGCWFGVQLLESCFTVLTNLHRARVELKLEVDTTNGEARDSFRLAIEALRTPLPSGISVAGRTCIRAAAARMLDSAIAAYEGVGRCLAKSKRGGAGRYSAKAKAGTRRAASATTAADEERGILTELVWLISSAAAVEGRAGGAAAAGAAAVATERAAVDGASALWQLMASGTVHPEDVITDLEAPLVLVLSSLKASADSERPAALRIAALGLMSCLSRAELVARRLWVSPLLPAMMKTHALARRRCADGDATTWMPVVECVRGVSQALCRCCHSIQYGNMVGPDIRVDRFRFKDRLMAELKCKLEYDRDEEAIMLVPEEEEEGY